MACIKAKSKAYEMVAKIPMFLASAMGGGLGDKPRWFNIFWIAVGFFDSTDDFKLSTTVLALADVYFKCAS